MDQKLSELRLICVSDETSAHELQEILIKHKVFSEEMGCLSSNSVCSYSSLDNLSQVRAAQCEFTAISSVLVLQLH